MIGRRWFVSAPFLVARALIGRCLRVLLAAAALGIAQATTFANTRHTNERWVFAITTGHAGTTFLSDDRMYNTSRVQQDSARICFTFEADHHFKRTGHPLRKWWQQRWTWENRNIYNISTIPGVGSVSDAHVPLSANSFVAKTMLPWYRSKCGADSRNVECADENNSLSECVSVLVDLGHHILLGLYPALLYTIGIEHTTFLRIRRSRRSTAVSFYSSNRRPCTDKGDFVLCPWEHGSELLDRLKEPRRKWDQLNDYQRCLWFVDEVEVKWALFRKQNPTVHAVVLNWTTKAEFAEVHTQIARLLATLATGATDPTVENVSGSYSIPRADQTPFVTTNPHPPKNHHTTADDFSADNLAEYKRWEEAYETIMGYGEDVKALVAPQQYN
jgi:hypothetical protein